MNIAPHCVIVGAGIGGLTLAYRLQRRARAAGRPLRISLLEAADRAGGVIASSRRDGFLLEHGPDSIIRSKAAGLALIEELGLTEAIQGTDPDLVGSLIAKGKRLLPIPDGLYLLAPGKMLPFLASPLISWRGKLRMGCDLLLPRRSPTAPEESLADFVRRRLGREALQRIAQPLVSGIYTADPEQLSLAHCMPQFPAMEREHRSLICGMRRRAKAAAAAGEGRVSGARYGLFLSLRDGLQMLVDRLLAELEGAIELRLQSPVERLARDGDAWRVQLAGGERLSAGSVAIAGPAHLAARLSAELDPELAAALQAIPYAGVATINLAFDRQRCPALPHAAGFVVPAIERRSLIACTFASSKYRDRSPGDGILLRAFIGGAMQAQALARSDDELLAVALADLRDFFPGLPPPRWSQVHRWPQTMAQPVLGHQQRLATIRRRESLLPGLALLGNGYEGVGIPDIIAQANSAAERLWAQLERGAGSADSPPTEGTTR